MQGPDCQQLVIEDLIARRTLGIERYGDALRPETPVDGIKEAYEEALDLACYLRQALEQIRALRQENAELRAELERVRKALCTPVEEPPNAELSVDPDDYPLF